MPRTKDQASRNVGGNANKDSNGDKQNRTPNRRDAYMGAMNKPAKKSPSAMSASDPKSKPQSSKLAPASSPRTKPSPQAGKMPSVSLPKVFGGGMTSPVSKVAPTKSPRPRRFPVPKAMSSSDVTVISPATKSRLAPKEGIRSKANPRRKQKTYPGRTPYNYAV